MNLMQNRTEVYFWSMVTEYLFDTRSFSLGSLLVILYRGHQILIVLIMMSFISVPGTGVRSKAGPIADRSQNAVSVQ